MPAGLLFTKRNENRARSQVSSRLVSNMASGKLCTRNRVQCFSRSLNSIEPLTLLKIAFYSPCQWLKRKTIFCRQGPSLLTTLPEGFHLHAAPGVVPVDRTLQPTPLPAFLSTYIPKVGCVVFGVTNVSSLSHGTVWYNSLLCSCKCLPQQRANLLVTSRSYSFWMGKKG